MGPRSAVAVLAVVLVCCGGRPGRAGGPQLAWPGEPPVGAGGPKEAGAEPDARAARGGPDVSAVATGSFTAPRRAERARVRKLVLPEAQQDPECRGGSYCGVILCRADVLLEGPGRGERRVLLLERAGQDGEGGLDYEVDGTVPLGRTGRDALVVRRESGYHTTAITSLLIVKVGARGTKVLWELDAMGENESESGESRLPRVEVESASPEEIVVLRRGMLEGTEDYPAPMVSERIALGYRGGRIVRLSVQELGREGRPAGAEPGPAAPSPPE